MPARVAIIGGGWAGLSCAVELAQKTTPATAPAITLYEAAPHCGGRARGLDWRGHDIDNGQHLTIGAYTETLALLNTVNAPAWIHEPLRWAGVERNAVLSHDWVVPNAAWPARILKALIPGKGPRGWPLAWKLSIALCLRALHKADWNVDRQGALRWLNDRRTPKPLIEHFWKPLIEGALNTPIEKACAQTVAAVLRDSLAGPLNATAVLQPKRNLSLDGVDPICDWLNNHGVAVRTGHRVSRLIPQSSTVTLEVRAGAQYLKHRFDAVVIALPHDPTVSLWEHSALNNSDAITRLKSFESSAITTVWIELGPAEKARLTNLPNWFVLNPIENMPHIGQVCVRRGDVLAVVVSAQLASELRLAKDTANEPLRAQLMAQLGIDIGRLEQKWVTEKQATWACTAQSHHASPEQAHGNLGIDRVYRCADDLEPRYPATIESAVRSGRRTAMTVLKALGEMP